VLKFKLQLYPYPFTSGKTMSAIQEKIPPRLEEIIENFEFCEGREKIELLLQYSENIQPLPERLSGSHDSMEQVQECMTPVFVNAEIENGKMHFYFDVPPESPTVRGFSAILAEGLDGLSPTEILNLPNNFTSRLGLESFLTPQRMNGFAATLAHLKRLAAQHLGG
jgi:cysteine desulfuration protein SufE